jgi:hypothetical protein
VVPIACAHSGSAELLGQHGVGIPAEASTLDEFGLVRPFIDREKCAAALRELLDDRTLLSVKSRAARKFAIDYSWEVVVKRWDNLLRATISSSSTLLPSAEIRTHGAKGDTQQVRVNDTRPSGHSAAILPVPRLGLPVRLQYNRSQRIITSQGVAKGLRGLEWLFPGLTVTPYSPIGTADLLSTVQDALLVIDPEHSLHPQIDVVCAVLGVSFLGSGVYWPAVNNCGLFSQARAVLTDMPLAEYRADIARRRVESNRSDGV